MPLKASVEPPRASDERIERRYARDFAGLTAQLQDDDAAVRRWAARDLARHDEAAVTLAARLSKEPAPEVREAIFDSLLALGSDEAVDELLVLLRSEDAALRNGAVMVLQQLPDPVGRRMGGLLADPDPDVRIMALDIVQSLPHPDAPRWLADVVQHDGVVNVVGVALDRLAEVGTPDLLPILVEAKQRFADEPYIQFAVDIVVRRIEGGPSAA
jgi:HEAT repeat protein